MPLSDLIAALAAATGPDYELDWQLAEEVFNLPNVGRGQTIPPYTSSLDAITGAIEARWPGCIWRADSAGFDATIQLDWMQHGDVSESGQSSSAPFALCLAAARLAAAEEGR